MAPAALQRLRQKCLPDRIGDIVQKLLASNLGDAHPGLLPGPHAKEADRDQHLRIIRVELVTGKLLFHELVVRLVAVERPHNVIAIPPRVRPLVVIREAGRVRVAHNVEPVSPPLLAIVRALQQTVDDFCEGRLVRRRVFQKRFNFIWSRWQTCEVEGRSPNEGSPVRSRSRFEECLAISPPGEQVDRVHGIRRTVRNIFREHRNVRISQRLPRPKVLAFVPAMRPVIVQAAAGLDSHTGGLCLHDCRNPVVFRPRCSCFDPLANGSHLTRRKPVGFLGGHLEIFVFPRDGLVKFTFRRLSWDECGTVGLAPLQQPLTRSDVEAGLNLLRVLAVASQAFLTEDRLDLQREQRFPGREFRFRRERWEVEGDDQPTEDRCAKNRGYLQMHSQNSVNTLAMNRVWDAHDTRPRNW